MQREQASRSIEAICEHFMFENVHRRGNANMEAAMEQAPLIVGAGPTGLAAAMFLAEAGVPCRIIDKAHSPSANSRAQVINPRSLELLQHTGVTDAILREAHPIHRVVFYEEWRHLRIRSRSPGFPDGRTAPSPD
jgi:2-polyprenyl-6-methoxyphenol hydroxylase-like FAD-dependent oxidoreductase